VRLLFLGDVFGRPGRTVIRDLLGELVALERADVVVANAENASGGKGLMPRDGKARFACGIAALTGGNHSFQHKESALYYASEPRTVRPANYPGPCPGRGWTSVEGPGGIKIGIANLMGRVFLNFALDCPFRAADRLIDEMAREGCTATVLDFHAEATAEQMGMGLYVDGRVGAVVGTHTHVQTTDARILPQGTAFMTDLGMCGPHGSIIGMEPNAVMRNLVLGRRHAFKPAKALAAMHGALIEFDDDGRALSIKPVSYPDVFRGGTRPAEGEPHEDWNSDPAGCNREGDGEGDGLKAPEGGGGASADGGKAAGEGSGEGKAPADGSVPDGKWPGGVNPIRGGPEIL
jgi:metallophosphoesterase (TIGR00282 family)